VPSVDVPVLEFFATVTGKAPVTFAEVVAYAFIFALLVS
jgi:hypothetical protein